MTRLKILFTCVNIGCFLFAMWCIWGGRVVHGQDESTSTTAPAEGDAQPSGMEEAAAPTPEAAAVTVALPDYFTGNNTTPGAAA